MLQGGEAVSSEDVCVGQQKATALKPRQQTGPGLWPRFEPNRWACLLLHHKGARSRLPATDDVADLIIHGGPILTMEGEQPAYAEAVAIDEGRFVFVGDKVGAMAPAEDFKCTGEA